MIRIEEMDENVKLDQQLEDKDGRPVVLINVFNVKPKDVNRVLQAWAEDAAFFKQKPGLISTQLHRGIGGSTVFLNYAVWESAAHMKQALSDPEFSARLAHYPDGTVSRPHHFRKVAVPGICVASRRGCPLDRSSYIIYQT